MLWAAWNLSRDLRKTPAEIYYVGENLEWPYSIGAELAAYSFNSAVRLFGVSLERELEGVTSNAKDAKTQEQQIEAGRTRILETWIPRASDATKPQAKPATAFADPAKR